MTALVALTMSCPYDVMSFYSDLQYQEEFSNWTVLSILIADEDDLPAKFSTYEYNAFVIEDALVVKLSRNLSLVNNFFQEKLPLCWFLIDVQRSTHPKQTSFLKQESTLNRNIIY